MSFASLRIGKIDQGTETAAHNHNLRASSSKEEENINKSLTCNNSLLLGRADTVKAINEKIDELNLKTAVRKDANRAIEFVMSASPDYFYDFKKAGITKEDWDEITIKNLGVKKYWERLAEIKKFTIQENVEAFQKNILKWVNEDPDLKNNVINLVVHQDEKTMHAHLLVVPVIDGKLTAKQFFTPGRAKYWQDTFARTTGLKRGISSDVKHQTKTDFALVKAAERGYKTGYKKGKEAGYKKGKEAGLAQATSVGAKVGAVITGWGESWHKPSQKAQAEIARATARAEAAEKEKKKAQEAAKATADNRVARAAEREKFERDRADGLAKDLDRAEGKLAEALSYLTPSQRDKFSRKI